MYLLNTRLITLAKTTARHTLSEVEQSVNDVSAAHNSVNLQYNEDRQWCFSLMSVVS